MVPTSELVGPLDKENYKHLWVMIDLVLHTGIFQVNGNIIADKVMFVKTKSDVETVCKKESE